MDNLPPITGSDKLIAAFGYFPTFHDAEITRMFLSRGEPKNGNPTLELTLHGWEMTSEVEDTGYLKLIKHHLVDFKFHCVDHVRLVGWNHQNVLFELIIKAIDHPVDHALIEIDLSSSYGLEGSFRAVSGEVLDVRPCDNNGVPTA